MQAWVTNPSHSTYRVQASPTLFISTSPQSPIWNNKYSPKAPSPHIDRILRLRLPRHPPAAGHHHDHHHLSICCMSYRRNVRYEMSVVYILLQYGVSKKRVKRKRMSWRIANHRCLVTHTPTHHHVHLSACVTCNVVLLFFSPAEIRFFSDAVSEGGWWLNYGDSFASITIISVLLSLY